MYPVSHSVSSSSVVLGDIHQFLDVDLDATSFSCRAEQLIEILLKSIKYFSIPCWTYYFDKPLPYDDGERKAYSWHHIWMFRFLQCVSFIRFFFALLCLLLFFFYTHFTIFVMPMFSFPCLYNLSCYILPFSLPPLIYFFCTPTFTTFPFLCFNFSSSSFVVLCLSSCSHPSLPLIVQVGDFGEQPSHHPRAAANFPEHVGFDGWAYTRFHCVLVSLEFCLSMFVPLCVFSSFVISQCFALSNELN